MTQVLIIDVISDVVCPWCYIGKRKLEAALAARPQIEAQITWRPFQLAPELPAEGVDREAYYITKFGSREKAEKIYAAVAQAGRAVGLDFAFDKIARIPNTLAAHRLIRWAGAAGAAGATGAQAAVVERLFQLYFLEGGDIGAPATLVGVAREAGMDSDLVADLLASDADADLVREEDVLARRNGVNGVPCFLIDGRYMLTGAQEPAAFHQVFEMVAAQP
jgi:predicted DsbA family dithiol-disulfide isomerase